MFSGVIQKSADAIKFAQSNFQIPYVNFCTCIQQVTQTPRQGMQLSLIINDDRKFDEVN